MTETFQAGDLVQLKSGSPIMTVNSADRNGGTGRVYCVWFEGNAQSRANFSPEALKKVPSPTAATATHDALPDASNLAGEQTEQDRHYQRMMESDDPNIWTRPS